MKKKPKKYETGTAAGGGRRKTNMRTGDFPVSGNGDAALYLAKAKMAMIAAHPVKRVRQADMRELVATE